MIRAYQLAHVCSNLDSEIKKYFRGIFSSNEITSAVQAIDLNKKNYIIFNSDPSHKSGSHWVSAFIDMHGRNVFIDSYDRSPSYYNLEKFFSDVCGDDYKTIGRQLQSTYTNVCGLYVVFFGHYLVQDYDLAKVLSLIPSERSKILRDREMYERFLKHYGKAIVLDKAFIDCASFDKLKKNQSCKNFQKMILDRKSL